MQVNEVFLVTPEKGDVTVSAAALFLLRTLERDHTKSDPVGEQLFPCCGHSMIDLEGEDVTIIGCPNGIDLVVKHLDAIQIQLETMEGHIFLVNKAEWVRAVIRFSDSVEAFYHQSAPKTPFEPFENKGFQKMLSEWKRRRRAAEAR